VTWVCWLAAVQTMDVAETTYDANIPVDGGDALVSSLFHELAGDELLESNDNAVFASYSDGGAAVLHCFDGIFDLTI